MGGKIVKPKQRKRRKHRNPKKTVAGKSNDRRINITGSIKKYLLPNLPYMVMAWFFNKVGEAYRISESDKIAYRMMETIENLNGTMAKVLPSLNSFDVLIGIIGGIAFYGIVWVRKKSAKNWRHDVEYGSARWGNRRDIEPFIDPNPDNNIILTATESLTMNNRPKPVKNARNKNVLVIGGSGSGKTRFFVKPNLMNCVSAKYPTSFAITDPKGSLIFETASMLRRKGYKIKVLNTIDFGLSMGYNPFNYIKSEKDILKFVTAFIENTQDPDARGSDPFWQKAEILLYQALIGYIFYESPDEDKNINTLVKFINKMKVSEEDESKKNPIDLMFEDLEEKNPDHFAVRQYAKFSVAAGKTLKSIIVMCGARLSPFDIKEVRELMQNDELELDKIGEEKTALFIVISDTDDAFNFIPAILYSQLFNILCETADIKHGGRLPVHVRFLLDEFANLGKIPKIEKLIATIRSREISACIILQAMSQLKAIYKDNADVIAGNCDSRLFLGGSEKTTLKDLTDALGKETVYLLNSTISKGQSASFSQNQQKLGKSLMSEDEISVMDGGKCILQLRGVRPFFSDKFDIESHKHYKYLSDANPKHKFNLEKYITRKLRIKPADEYEFFEYDGSDTELPPESLFDYEDIAYDSDDFDEDLEPI